MAVGSDDEGAHTAQAAAPSAHKRNCIYKRGAARFIDTTCESSDVTVSADEDVMIAPTV